MAQATIYVLEAMNLFCGDHDPTASKHLTITEFALPPLEEMTQDHLPGGAPVQVEFTTGIQKLAPTFKLAGFDPDVLTLFGLNTKMRNNFTGYGKYVDKRKGTEVEAKVILEGRLGMVKPDPWKRGDLQHHDYGIKEVMHYELYFDGAEKIYWDFWTNTWRVDNVDQNSVTNQILRIPTSG